ncbi:DNA primase large subunit isoform X4 [Rhinatrema bivittatum]|uniref:DNA primase large subunit isoform X4 n=1 Tax=Rhinatrema bivittatum TaxID=194408 RepID=UPI00112B1287|nr:DNA primase large subunit isoform X4 [Rhinatrema bivittatum]
MFFFGNTSFKKMEFRSWKRHTKLTKGRKEELYPYSLQFYQQPPAENISLVEFETLAVERLKLLKTIENLGVSFLKGSDKYKEKLETELRKLKFPYRDCVGDDGLNDDGYDQRRKDHISHFIVRLAYCQSEDLRRWFIQQEMDLFRFRFGEMKNETIQQFLSYNNLTYQTISKDEKNLHANDFRDSSFALSTTKVEEQEFFKVHFQDALDLVRARKVFLQSGFVYVPFQEIVVIVLNDFRAKLSKALALSARSLPVVQSDERLQPLLNHLSHSYLGQDYSTQRNAGKISLEQIDAFDKSYAYNVRHSYGKEGKRTDYTPYSCMKIILTNPPSQGDYHGCPFRHSDPELLKQKLQSYKIPPTGINQILELVKGMHYQLACQKYFELTHNVDDCGFSLNHPNQYFVESQKLLTGGRDVKKESNIPESSQTKASSQKSASMVSSSNITNSAEDLEEFFSED